MGGKSHHNEKCLIMSNLITDCQKNNTADIFADIFDTWSRPIIIYKEPIKQQILPQDNSLLFGFGQTQGAEIYTYTPVTGIFPALIRYQNKFGSMSADDSFQGDLNTYIADVPVSIKVKKDCSDFILDGKTEIISVDNFSYILKIVMPNPHIFWNTEYFIFDLERKM